MASSLAMVGNSKTMGSSRAASPPQGYGQQNQYSSGGGGGEGGGGEGFLLLCLILLFARNCILGRYPEKVLKTQLYLHFY